MYKKGDSAYIFFKDAKLEVIIKTVKRNSYVITFKDYRNLKKKYGIGFIPITNEKIVNLSLLH